MLAALPQRRRKQTVVSVGRIPTRRRVVLRPSHGLRSPFDSSRTPMPQSPTLMPLTAIVGHCMGRLQSGCSTLQQSASQAAAVSQSGCSSQPVRLQQSASQAMGICRYLGAYEQRASTLQRAVDPINKGPDV